MLSIKYKQAFEKKSIQLMVEAYKTSLNEKVIQLDWDENDISAELHRHIEGNPLRKKWKIVTNVEAHIPIENNPKVKGYANKNSRIDFRFATFISIYEYEYFFEAKNLKQNDSKLKRRYIRTGIDSFISEKYPNGCLIGYLLEGNIEATVKGINSLLEKDKRTKEILEQKKNELLESYFESNHSNFGTLKHLIFDFTLV